MLNDYKLWLQWYVLGLVILANAIIAPVLAANTWNNSNINSINMEGTNNQQYAWFSSPIISKHDVGVDGVNAYLKAVFDRNMKGSIAYVIYEFQDDAYIGLATENGQRKIYFCTEQVMSNDPDGHCNAETPVGQLILRPGHRNTSMSGIIIPSKAASPDGTPANVPHEIVYGVNVTGFYILAISTLSPDSEYSVVMKVQNAHGSLPAEQYPLWQFYYWFMMVYLAFGIMWGVLTLWHRKEIISVQFYLIQHSLITKHYIFVTIGIVFGEVAMRFWFFDYINQNGDKSNVLLVLVVLFNALRNTISLFILLIVSMGYGVVRPTIGSMMNRALSLTYVHFACSMVDSGATFLISRQDRLLLLLLTLPLSITYTLFFAWIVSSLKETRKKLELRRQSVKLRMYVTLWKVLVGFFILTGVIAMAMMIFVFRNVATVSWYAANWQSEWFFRKGWADILFFLGFFIIAFIWRPRTNNRRYGLEQIPDAAPDAADPFQMDIITVGVTGDQHDMNLRGARGHGSHSEIEFQAELGGSEEDYHIDGDDAFLGGSSSSVSKGKGKATMSQDDDLLWVKENLDDDETIINANDGLIGGNYMENEIAKIQ